MDFTGEYRLPAPREAVWAALNDLGVLKACIPGCETLQAIGGGRMATTVVTRIGPIKVRFNGELRLENIDGPARYAILGEGKGGFAGSARGRADIDLAEAGAETILRYRADAAVGGRLARIGERFVEAAARSLVGQFFDSFAAVIAGRVRRG